MAHVRRVAQLLQQAVGHGYGFGLVALVVVVIAYLYVRAEGYDLVSYLVLESYHNSNGKQHDGDSQGDACGRYDDSWTRHVVLAAAAMHFARYKQFKIHALTL